MKTVECTPRQRNIAITICVLLFSAAGVCAQAPPDTVSSSTPGTTSPATGAPAVGSSEADAVQKRMDRARALAAAHQLTSAAMELESIRASAKDEMWRNVSSLMLMGIYLEDGNYARAEAMLEEAFKHRSSKSESSVRTYYALAGQAVNGARLHVGRYRIFGINVSSDGLPHEATFDLDRLRSLLERMTAQAKTLLQQNGKDNDAFALLEDLSGIRITLARDNEDRARWQNVYSAARARLATLPTEVASTVRPVAASGSAEVPKTRILEPSGGSEASVESANTEKTTNTQTPDVNTNTSSSAADTPATSVAGAVSTFEVGPLLEKATKRVDPLYPQTAKNVGISGLVRVKLVIDESGSVANIVWTEGPMLLRQAAQDAVRQWKFRPLVVDGKPVRAAGYIDFGFSR